MVYYFIIIFFFLATGSKRLVLNHRTLLYYGQKYEKIIFLLTAIFLCGGYMTGSDWRGYEISYYQANWSNIKYYMNEKMFYVLMIISRYIIPNFFIFLIACKLSVFYIFYRFFKEYSPNVFISYFLYIPLFGLFLFIDNPLRYMIALGFVTLSYEYILNQNFLKFILYVILGALFHYTVLVFIPFYFLKKINIHRALLSIIFIAWMLIFTTDNLLYILGIISNYIPIITLKYSGYIIKAEEVDKVFSLGSLMNIVFFFWIIANKKQIETNLNYGKVFYSMSIIYLFFTKLSVILPAGFRFSYLFAPFFVITVTYVFQINKNKLKQIFSLGVALYIFLFTYKRIDNSYVYIPYSNYIINAATDNLYDYNYRSSYNLNDFHKRKGKRYKY